MGTGGNLRHHTAIAAVLLPLGPHHIGEDLPGPIGGTRDDGGGATRAAVSGSATSEDATGWLIDLTRERDDIHLIAVGPLTNVALAIRRDPVFVERLASLTIMGGGASKGNKRGNAEWLVLLRPATASHERG